jgi:hypothetical protein
MSPLHCLYMAAYYNRSSILIGRQFSFLLGCTMDSFASGKSSVTGCCERGNEPSVSIKRGEFHDNC